MSVIVFCVNQQVKRKIFDIWRFLFRNIYVVPCSRQVARSVRKRLLRRCHSAVDAGNSASLGIRQVASGAAAMTPGVS